MRMAWWFCVVSLGIGSAGLGVQTSRLSERVDTLERLVSARQAAAASGAATPGRGWRASNGVVLTADELARIERRTPAERHADAVLEYITLAAARNASRPAAK